MQATNTNRMLRALEDLLDAERNSILQGELVGIPRLIKRKEALLERMSATADDSDTLLRIREKAGRNTALLEAALKGVRNAINRLEILRAGRRTLNTYDKSGQRLSLGGSANSALEKKA